MQHQKKQKHRQLRKWRIRKKVVGTAARPRMSVCFTSEHIYVQFIDDSKGVTVASASTRHKGMPDREKLAANVESAKKVGSQAGEAAKGKGITKIVFDRNGAPYHGKVKALAEAARAAGLQF
jgi:large subunit ribosomal protein L18